MQGKHGAEGVSAGGGQVSFQQEHVREGRGERHGAALSVLGRPVIAAPHVDKLGREIHVAPLQGANLSRAQASEHAYREHGAPGLA